MPKTSNWRRYWNAAPNPHRRDTACRRTTIRRDFDADLGSEARPIDIEMVFRNLIDNAVKYAGEVPDVGIDLAARR